MNEPFPLLQESQYERRDYEGWRDRWRRITGNMPPRIKFHTGTLVPIIGDDIKPDRRGKRRAA